MIFQEILESVSEKEIVTAIIDKYPSQKTCVTDYFTMIEKLKLMQPEIGNKDMLLCVFPSFELFDAETVFEDVVGYSKKEKECYALDLTPWNEWLGMEVNQKCLEHYGNAEFIAHCLYEMSFISFDENKIQETVKELKDIEKGIENGTLKTYSMQEVFEELNIDPLPEKTENEKQEEKEILDEILRKNEQIRKKFL